MPILNTVIVIVVILAIVSYTQRAKIKAWMDKRNAPKA